MLKIFQRFPTVLKVWITVALLNLVLAYLSHLTGTTLSPRASIGLVIYSSFSEADLPPGLHLGGSFSLYHVLIPNIAPTLYPLSILFIPVYFLHCINKYLKLSYLFLSSSHTRKEALMKSFCCCLPSVWGQIFIEWIKIKHNVDYRNAKKCLQSSAFYKTRKRKFTFRLPTLCIARIKRVFNFTSKCTLKRKMFYHFFS